MSNKGRPDMALTSKGGLPIDQAQATDHFNSPLLRALRFLVSIPVRDLFHFEKHLLFARVFPYTMAGYARLSNTYDLARSCEEKGLEGAFVECGVWRGGMAGVMAYVAEKAGSRRKIWLLDSFEGLPEPTVKDGARAVRYASHKDSGRLAGIGKCVGTLEVVENVLFSVLGLDQRCIVLDKGWFQLTLPKARERIGTIALLRLDADRYESTKVCLENLYDQVISRGYVIIDDYGHWEGCREAVDSFLSDRQIDVRMVETDETGMYFRKP